MNLFIFLCILIKCKINRQRGHLPADGHPDRASLRWMGFLSGHFDILHCRGSEGAQMKCHRQRDPLSKGES